MKFSDFVTAGAFVTFLIASASGAEKDRESIAVIEKAIKAHGGLASLKRASTYYAKGEGVLVAPNGESAEYTSEFWSTKGKYRIETRIKLVQGGVMEVAVVDGQVGWIVRDGVRRDMTGAEKKIVPFMLRVGYWENLYPLLDETDINVSYSGESELRRRKLVGIKIRIDGRLTEAIDFYFEKDSHLLAGYTFPAMDNMGKNELRGERWFDDYKENNGVKLRHRCELYLGGKTNSIEKTLEYKFPEKLDDSLFAK